MARRALPEGIGQARWLTRCMRSSKPVRGQLDPSTAWNRRTLSSGGWSRRPRLLFAIEGVAAIDKHEEACADIAQGIGRFLRALRRQLSPARRRWRPVLWQLPGALARQTDTLAASSTACRRAGTASSSRHELVLRRRLRAAAPPRRGACDGDSPRAGRGSRSSDDGMETTALPLRPPRGRRGNYYGGRSAGGGRVADRLAGRGPPRFAEVLAYFNNDWEGFASPQCSGLRRML